MPTRLFLPVLSIVLLAIWTVASVEPAHALPYVLDHTLANPDPDYDDEFGLAVALGEGKVLVGAPHLALLPPNQHVRPGSAHLFDAATGALLHSFESPAPSNGDLFGWSVALVAGKALVGTPEGPGDGTVYVFDTDTGVLLGTLANPAPSQGDRFGFSLAALGTEIFVGAIGDDNGIPHDPSSGYYSGAVYRFDLESRVLLQTYFNPSPAPDDLFGWSIAPVGGDLAVAAPLDEATALDGGAVYLIDLVTGEVLATYSQHIAGEQDRFGTAVGVVEDTLLVAASFGGGRPAMIYRVDLSGEVVMTFETAAPVPDEQLHLPFAALGSDFVLAAASDPGPGSEYGVGAVLVVDGATGEPLQTLVPPPGGGGFFGAAVAAEGATLVVGAPFDSIGTDYAGAVYVYTVNLCGNGDPDAGETCDDGNAIDGDGCDANCTPTGCGNGIVTSGETCDDGNVIDGALPRSIVSLHRAARRSTDLALDALEGGASWIDGMPPRIAPHWRFEPVEDRLPRGRDHEPTILRENTSMTKAT